MGSKHTEEFRMNSEQKVKRVYVDPETHDDIRLLAAYLRMHEREAVKKVVRKALAEMGVPPRRTA
jgi:DNA-binding protein YbaB